MYATALVCTILYPFEFARRNNVWYEKAVDPKFIYVLDHSATVVFESAPAARVVGFSLSFQLA